MENNKFLFVFGTRPEAIKLISLFKLLSIENSFTVKSLNTGQHDSMLNQVLDFFEIIPDFKLNLERGKNLSSLTAEILQGINTIIESAYQPDFVIVQGDTTSAMAGALAAFYAKIKIIHIEAGLRTNDKNSPFPEEINRKIISSIADYHFSPTKNAVVNLIKEGINQNVIWNVGNTVIDSLQLVLKKAEIKGSSSRFESSYNFVNASKKLILVTAHRRENLGESLKEICKAIKSIVEMKDDIQVVFPVHLNPAVRRIVFDELKDYPSIHLLEPLSYADLVWFLSKCFFVITDSGGIQEEAPSLGKPVLIIRESTEREEGIESGNAKLVGTKAENIISECLNLLDNESFYKKMSIRSSIYGNGDSGKKIVSEIKNIILNSSN